MSKETLKVSKIRNGTVIDHITKGRSLDVIKILGIDSQIGGVLTIAMNVPSGKLGVKDVVKIEGRELNPQEVDKIALISPSATINIIRNFKVFEKQTVKLPSVVQGIVRCIKPSCISNSKSEPVKPVFHVCRKDNLRLRCHYCNTIIEQEEILQQV